MSADIEHLIDQHQRALERYRALQAEAEQASDRGGRGPTPADLAEARLEAQILRARIMRARDAIQRPTIETFRRSM